MSELSEKLIARLGCPRREFPAMKDPAPIMAAYQEARERGGREGFVPLLLPAEDPRFSQFLEGPWLEKHRQKLAAEPVMDGRACLDRLAQYYRESYAEDGLSWPDEEIIGEMAGGEAVDRFLSVSDNQGETIPLLLAEIPAKHPWEVFAYLPFGGWNDCPPPEDQMAVAKYWFERYGAVPAVMTADVLEYDLPAPVGRERAMDLAMEQYAFCYDIVDQGCGTIGLLADTLAKSSKWFFWWD